MDKHKGKITKWLKERKTITWIAIKVGASETTVRRYIVKWGLKRPVTYQLKNIKQEVKTDRKIQNLSDREKITKKKYKSVLAEVEILKKKNEAIIDLSQKPKKLVIRKSIPKGASEATIIALFSDWHIEEEVKKEAVSGLNEYNLKISEQRAKQCFSRLLRLVKIEQQNVKIDTLVIGLLGDFISSDIHEDTSKSALLEPSHAIVKVRGYIKSGIQFLLDNSDLNIKLICHTGNHGRKDKNLLIANEAGNSLEYLMYHFLKADFEGEDRIEFYIPEGYHSYLDVYGTIIRFHHGHAIRYGGGIGGITIPVNKAIAGWNEGRKADIDCFGHFHQFLDGETFLANGSMIGYNAYALFIKARYQPPKQMVFGIHSRVGKFVTRPILFK